jgi:hypothetical protein
MSDPRERSRPVDHFTLIQKGFRSKYTPEAQDDLDLWEAMDDAERAKKGQRILQRLNRSRRYYVIREALGQPVPPSRLSRARARPAVDPFLKKPIKLEPKVRPHTPLHKRRHLEFPPGIVPSSRPSDPFKRASQFPPLVIDVPRPEPHKDRWRIPTGRRDPFPRDISQIPMGDRQSWLRSYYRANPPAAERARSEARTMIDWAHRHLR